MKYRVKSDLKISVLLIDALLNLPINEADPKKIFIK